jgi:hypothetical protein
LEIDRRARSRSRTIAIARSGGDFSAPVALGERRQVIQRIVVIDRRAHQPDADKASSSCPVDRERCREEPLVDGLRDAPPDA